MLQGAEIPDTFSLSTFWRKLNQSGFWAPSRAEVSFCRSLIFKVFDGYISTNLFEKIPENINHLSSNTVRILFLIERSSIDSQRLLRNIGRRIYLRATSFIFHFVLAYDPCANNPYQIVASCRVYFDIGYANLMFTQLCILVPFLLWISLESSQQ